MIRIALLTVLAAGLASVGAQDWDNLPGPSVPGGTVDALALAPSTPDTVYALVRPFAGYTAGDSSRLFRSRDAGLAWRQVYTFTPPVGTLAVDPADPDTLYAGRSDGLFRSSDGGYGEVGELFLDARWPGVIYAGTQMEGVYRSTDGGDTWEQWRTGLAGEANWVYAMAVDPVGILYAATGDGVYQWDPGSSSWLPFGLQGQRTWALTFQRNSGYALLAGTGQGLWLRELVFWRHWFPLTWFPK
jgi:photosystem II stability/assembly factor-like uncharacterized protein